MPALARHIIKPLELLDQPLGAHPTSFTKEISAQSKSCEAGTRVDGAKWRQRRMTTMDSTGLLEFATKYAAAWCSQNATSVAGFFAEGGSLTINEGIPSVGRTAITAAAQEFMTAFPDMVVTMDGVTLQGGDAIFRWTLTGTNTGPGGRGKAVRISGYEEWTIGADGLIAQSKGHFDEADYQRQLSPGVGTQ
jgi:hypothetical protein